MRGIFNFFFKHQYRFEYFLLTSVTVFFHLTLDTKTSYSAVCWWYIGCCYVVTSKVEFLSIHRFPLYDSSSKTRLLCWIDAWRNAGYTAPCSLLCCFCKPFDLTLKAVLCQTEVEAKRDRTLSVQSRGPSINDAVLSLLPSCRTSGASSIRKDCPND